MMRPQVRIPLVLFSSIVLIGTTVHSQTLLPWIVDESGNFQKVETAMLFAEDPAAEPAPAGQAEDESKTPAGQQQPPQPKEPAPAQLSPQMAALRDQVRRTLSQVYAYSVDAQGNLPAEVIEFCETFGNKAEIASGGRSAQKINAVGAVCWNYPCGGYKLLRTDGKQIVAQVGYGHQNRPAQLLAMLARNRVPPSYELRVGDHQGTVADLVASEKRDCRQGLDQSATLIGLAFYAEPGETWENDLGETWSVERLLKEELDRKPDAGRVDVIDRLAAISFALKELKKDKVASEVWERAQKHIDEFHDYALGLQNADGSWHPGFFAYRGTSSDSTGSLYATGAILAWLVDSLPKERLEDERLVRGLGYLQKQLASVSGRRSATSSSALAVVGQLKAARAMSLYDTRYFIPRTPKEPAAAASPSQQASQPADGRSAPEQSSRNRSTSRR